jgi:hypothetical protein
VIRDKFVVRLLDADHQLLAWQAVWARPKPQGGGRSCPFFPEVQTQFAVQQSGVVSLMSVHWCDLDIARMSAVPETPVSVGQVFTFHWFEPVWLTAGSQGVPLPPVTVGTEVIVVPTGALAATS